MQNFAARLIVALFALSMLAAGAGAAEADWVKQSNQNAQALLKLLARYTPEQAAQATAYLYGYKWLMALRAETRVRLGSQFDRQKFNDFILSQGLLPPDLMQKSVDAEFIPALETKAERP